MQGCSVVVEAQQLEYGGRADVVISTARGGCFLQDHVMQVSSYWEERYLIENRVSNTRVCIHPGPALIPPGII